MDISFKDDVTVFSSSVYILHDDYTRRGIVKGGGDFSCLQNQTKHKKKKKYGKKTKTEDLAALSTVNNILLYTQPAATFGYNHRAAEG